MVKIAFTDFEDRVSVIGSERLEQTLVCLEKPDIQLVLAAFDVLLHRNKVERLRRGSGFDDLF